MNGKLRGHITVPIDADQAACTEAALANAQVMKFVGGAAVRRVVVVPGKLVNVVI